MSIRECKSTRASVTVAVTVAILLVSAVAQAATGGAPLTIAHSGYLLDGADAPLSSAGGLSMKFRIYDLQASGTPQWEGTCATVQVVRGYYTVLLGSAACVGSTAPGLDPVLDTNDLPTTGERWLEVEVGGVTMSPRMAVATVPTAAVATRALDSDTVKGEAPIALHDASKLTGVAPATVLGTGYTGLTTVGTVTTGTWQGTKVADAYVDGAATWNAMLAAVAHDGTLVGDGTAGANQLKVNLGTEAGTVAAGNDARFGQWSGTTTTTFDPAAARTTLGLGTAATTLASAYATAVQGATADAALPRAGGTITGAVNFPGNGIWNLAGNVGLGTPSPAASLDMGTKTDGFIWPKGTTADRPASPNTGTMRYNTSVKVPEYYNGTRWVSLGSPAGSGGTFTTSGGYTYHAFTSSGTFTVAAALSSVDILVVGGGAAGSIDHGGGGGGGGVALVEGYVLPAGSYAVTVGAGGAAGSGTHYSGSQNGGTARNYPPSVSGGDSSFGSLVIAFGGGGGRGCCDGLSTPSGGSSGGVGSNASANAVGGDATKGTIPTGAVGATYGNVGGGGGDTSGAGGGGGGAGAAGANSQTGRGGDGIRPVVWADSWGTNTSNAAGGGYLGGGGAGGQNAYNSVVNNSWGGYGGGGGWGTLRGNCSTVTISGRNGMPNTGGGGAGVINANDATAGAGGSGIVLIRY